MDQIMMWKSDQDSELGSTECSYNYHPLRCHAFERTAKLLHSQNLKSVFWTMNGGFALSPVNQSVITTDNFYSFFLIKRKSLVPITHYFLSFLYSYSLHAGAVCLLQRSRGSDHEKEAFSWTFKTRCLTSRRLSNHPHKIPSGNLTNQKNSGIKPNQLHSICSFNFPTVQCVSSVPHCVSGNVMSDCRNARITSSEWKTQNNHA